MTGLLHVSTRLAASSHSLLDFLLIFVVTGEIIRVSWNESNVVLGGTSLTFDLVIFADKKQ